MSPLDRKQYTNVDKSSSKAIIILGAPNDSCGTLSPIAQSRADLATALYHDYGRVPVIVTGGFGPSFNVTSYPHSFYLQKYLLSQGIRSTDLIECGTTSNTVDDAIHSRPLLDKLRVDGITVVTSDFHVKRSQLIFRAVYPNLQIKVVGAHAVISTEDVSKLRKHEQRATQMLKAQGGIIVEGRNFHRFIPLIASRTEGNEQFGVFQ